jgi:hypothetical protein
MAENLEQVTVHLPVEQARWLRSGGIRQLRQGGVDTGVDEPGAPCGQVVDFSSRNEKLTFTRGRAGCACSWLP